MDPTRMMEESLRENWLAGAPCWLQFVFLGLGIAFFYWFFTADKRGDR